MFDKVLDTRLVGVINRRLYWNCISGEIFKTTPLVDLHILREDHSFCPEPVHLSFPFSPFSFTGTIEERLRVLQKVIPPAMFNASLIFWNSVVLIFVIVYTYYVFRQEIVPESLI